MLAAAEAGIAGQMASGLISPHPEQTAVLYAVGSIVLMPGMRSYGGNLSSF